MRESRLIGVHPRSEQCGTPLPQRRRWLDRLDGLDVLFKRIPADSLLYPPLSTNSDTDGLGQQAACAPRA